MHFIIRKNLVKTKKLLIFESAEPATLPVRSANLDVFLLSKLNG